MLTVLFLALVAAAHNYSVGDHVRVLVMNQSYPAVVTKVYLDTVYTIRYDAGYGDYATLLEYIHPPSGGAWKHAPTVGNVVKVRYGQADYTAHVIGVRQDRVYRVRYADGSEWATIGDYMRPPTDAKPAAAPAPAAPAAAASVASAAGAPVQYTFLGMDPKASAIRYRIHVNTPKPISEVHIATKFVAANGSVVNDTTLIWQNIVHSKRQPIENGKSYDDTSYLFPNTARVDSHVVSVVFTDSTRWEAR